MARKKKHEEHEAHANHERWMLSYADMLTLLLALFIVMFAISKVDQKKYEIFAQGTAQAFGQANLAMQGEVGTLDGGDGILKDQAPGQQAEVPAVSPDQASPLTMQAALQREQAARAAASAERENLKKIQQKISNELKAAGLENAAKFEINERGLVVNIVTDKVLFDTGKAELRPAGRKVIDTVAPILKGIPNYMSIEGHTDDVPLNGVRSNWELSTDRASAVLRTLVTDGIPMSKISASGYADQRPIASNKNDAGRSKNRRVAVVVLPTVPLGTSASAAHAAQQPVPAAPASPAAPAAAAAKAG